MLQISWGSSVLWSHNLYLMFGSSKVQSMRIKESNSFHSSFQILCNPWQEFCHFCVDSWYAHSTCLSAKTDQSNLIRSSLVNLLIIFPYVNHQGSTRITITTIFSWNGKVISFRFLANNLNQSLNITDYLIWEGIYFTFVPFTK